MSEEKVADSSQNETTLQSTALNNGNWMRRRAAVSWLENQRVLEHVAQHDKVWCVRAAAAERLDNRAILEELMDRDPEVPVRSCAHRRYLDLLREIDDQADLEKVASEGSDAECREVATSRLNNQDILLKIAEGDESWRVRAVAVRRLGRYGSLAEVLLLEGDRWVQEVAKEQGEELLATSGQGCQ